MSIWCSWPAVGHEPLDPDEPLRGGEVRTYAQGFSNHYPDLNKTHELPACIDLASIAPWCVPGHGQALIDEVWSCPGCGEDHDAPEVGPWLRLGITADAGLNFWTKVDGQPTREHVEADVVLDEAAVRQLRDDLNEWLAMPKVQPVAPAAASPAQPNAETEEKSDEC